MSDKSKQQSPEEETVNWITHGIGVVLILIFFPFLLMETMEGGTTGLIAAVAVFGFGMLLAYSASTLYHYVKDDERKRKLRIWDHIGIFVLIGGSYAPIVCQYTSNETATWFLGVMWTLIAAGSVLKLFFIGKYEIVSVVIYLVLGWMVVFIFQPIRANMPMEIFYWILAGGLAYTVGVVFYKWRSLKYQHGIWHLFVLAGTACHFVAIYKGM